jgi:thioesterase domain-containing protein
MDTPARSAASLSPVKRQLLEQLLKERSEALPTKHRGPVELPLVLLQPDGVAPPLFFLPPAGGSPLCYVDLARELGPDQPFYGFQSPGLLDGQQPLAHVSEMARRYISVMRAAEPEGPYLLGGWSFGAMVAFEMAAQLEAEGVPVGLVAMIDGGPFHSEMTWQLTNPLHVIGLLLGLARFTTQIGCPTSYSEIRRLASWVGISLPPRLRDVRQRSVGAQWRFTRRLVSDMFGSGRLFTANTVASINYRPQPYGGRTVLFRTGHTFADPKDPFVAGLRKYATGDANVVDPIAGNHMTLLLDPGHVRTLAGRLAAHLQRVDRHHAGSLSRPPVLTHQTRT